MKNEPLSSTDQSKIIIFALVMLPAIFMIVGIIPAFLLLFGMFMMKKNRDFSHIKTAVEIYKGYFYLALTAASLCALMYATTLGSANSWERGDEEFYTSLVFIGVAIVYIILVNKLFLSPLEDHCDWVEINGVFSNKPKSPTEKKSFADIDIIKGHKGKYYSVAGELIKWGKLKEDGCISNDEYNEIKSKLLQ